MNFGHVTKYRRQRMLKSNLVRKVWRQHAHVAPQDIRIAVNTILNTISTALTRGQRVELRGFGTFSSRAWTRTIRDPRTSEVITTTAKRTAHFKPGKAARDRVNKQA